MPPVKQLNPEVARKIAAGEVIDRPNAIIRELMDNAVDSGATKIRVEITSGGIEKIRVSDNGCGMSKDDLFNCARSHATSKITSETDLLKLHTLGFRGEALSSMAAVSRLEITSGGYKMNASLTEDHIITPHALTSGTIVQTAGLFENFPARRVFLKRPASEGVLCKKTFEEKVLPRPDIGFSFCSDGDEQITLNAGQTLLERFVQTTQPFETESQFVQLESSDPQGQWSFKLIIGDPSVSRSTRKEIFIYVNGRRIQEYSLLQAIEYGAQGNFPNGTHPVACLFVEMDPSQVDFNIHPAKREARFKDINSLHHGVSSTVKIFFKQYTVKNLIEDDKNTSEDIPDLFTAESINPASSISSRLEKEQEDSGSPDYAFKHTPGIANIKTPGLNLQSHSESASGHTQKTPSQNDARTIFFGSSRKSTAQKLADALTSDSLTQEEQDTASVPGRTTKMNYLPKQVDSFEEDGFHFVGSTMGTFLIAEKNDVLYIIDQHGAHERIIYNQIMQNASEYQTLLVPYILETSSPAEDNYLESIKDSLKASGFSIENQNDGTWQVKTVPIRWKGTQEELKTDILEKRINPADIIHSVAASTACRRAVMDGHALDEKTASDIARQALELEDPHCPHGRPVYTKITRRQLFELVKRI